MLSKKIIPIIVLAFSGLLAFSQENAKPDCSIMKNGVFKYLDIEDTSAYIVIKNGTHTEYHNNGKYNITSRMKWVNSCEYNMTMASITIPDFPFKPGDVMNVKITSIENNIIQYTSTVKGQSWNGRLKIIELAGKPL
jgi:hypothetical protein